MTRRTPAVLPAANQPAPAVKKDGPVIHADTITLGRPASGRLRVVFFANPRRRGTRSV